MDIRKVTRFEVIDHRENTSKPGRCIIVNDELMGVELSVQDDGRILKVFLSDKEKQ